MDCFRLDAGEAMTDEYRSPVWLESAAVFSAMLLSAIALSAAFSDFDWLAPVLISVVLVVLVGTIFRSVPVLRASGTAVIAQCVVGLIAVIVLCAPSTLFLGFVPSPSSFTAVIDLLSEGVADLYATTPPAASTPGFTAMLAIAFTLITILIDGLVSDLKAPKVSGVLLLVLWMIPVFFAPAQVQWWHVLAIAAAFLLLILSPYFPAAKWRGGLTAMLAGGLALIIGLGTPLLLPGIQTVTNRGSGSQGNLTVTNPFLDLRADLGQRDDSELFSYTTTDPEPPPLRLTSIDSFDGQNWAPTPFPLDPFAIAADGLPWPQGLPRETGFSKEKVTVSIGQYDQQYLPTPYAPAQPEGLDRRWIFDEKTLTVVGNGEKTSGIDYSMEYLSAASEIEDMQNATPVNSAEFETELDVPDSLPESVSETAETVTSGAGSQWEAAALLQAYFRSGEFEYSLDAPEKASGDAISDFLVDKKGYCVQFSSAMTIMARTMGIPARIAVGFASGTKSGDQFSVSMEDSHAWPELYFEGVGWVRFEPTPGGPAGAPPPWTITDGSSGGNEDDAESTESPSPVETEEPVQSEAPVEEEPSETQTVEAAPSAQPIDSTVIWAIVIAIVILLLLAVPAVWRLILRRRRTQDPANLENIWTEIRALCVDFGQSLDPSRTLRYDEIILIGKMSDEGSVDGRKSSGPDGEKSSPGPVDAGPQQSTIATGVRGGSNAAGASTDGVDSDITALHRPLPTQVAERRGQDSSIASFVDALEAERYGSHDQSLSAAEVSNLVDEVKTALSHHAAPRYRITAVLFPGSLFQSWR